MKTPRLIVVAAATALALLTGCASTPDAEPAGDPVKIGMVTPLTGIYSALGNGALAAVQSEVERLNESGGIDGHPIELVYKDDKSEADQAVIAYNDLAADSEIVAILGSSSVTNSAATGPAIERAEIPTIALGPVHIFADGSNPYAFTVPGGTGLYAQEIISYAKAEGLTSIAIAYSRDPYGEGGHAATSAIAQQAGLDVVLDEAFDGLATDFTALITHIDEAAPDAVIVWGAGPSVVVIAKQFASAEIDAQMIFTGAQGSHLFLEPTGEAAEGLIVATSISVAGQELPDSDLKDAIDAFAVPFEEASGVYPPQFSFDGAAGMQLLQAAIEKAGSVDRAAIRDALETLDVLTSNGHYRFAPDDHMGLSTDAITVMTVVDGGFVATPYALDTFAAKLGQ